MSVDRTKHLEFSPLHRLQWEEAQQKHVILYPEGMVELNPSAAEILQLCDGTRRVEDIVEELERKFETSGLTDDIIELVEVALANGWIRELPHH
jgi:pyrroloquinoline quinone biosynthesis protein D